MTGHTRIAVVADLAEENWPSMDLVAEMLSASLRRESVDVSLIRPRMVRRFSGDSDMRSAPYGVDRLINRLWDYPRVMTRHRDSFSVFHIADHSYSHLVHSLPASRTVVSCHDLDTFRSVLDGEAEPRSRAFRVMTGRILSGFRKAARVACISEATRAAVLRHGLLPPHRVAVVPLGLHPAFLREDDTEADGDIQRLLGCKEPDAVEILHVGSTIPRKRIDVLLRVFHGVRLRLPHARLIRVGGPFTASQQALVSTLGLEGSVVTLPRLSWTQMAALYRRAHTLVLTSEREGFGLPVVEALSAGTPVVVSDLPALRESGGTVATYCEVGDIEGWISAVLETLHGCGGMAMTGEVGRKERIAHARTFAWSACAARLLDLYQDLLAEVAD